MQQELFVVPPMDCKSVETLPAGDDWQYEIKFDGYRANALKQHGEVQLFSRRGRFSAICFISAGRLAKRCSRESSRSG
jgi:hypothetical protein